MAYRPSFAGFELNVGSALGGLFPASFQAALIGSGLMLVWFMGEAAIVSGAPDPAFLFVAIPLLGLVAIFIITIATVTCALYIALVGVPLASLLGRRLETPTGLVVAGLAALLAGFGATAMFPARPPFSAPDWQYSAMVLAYALPAGLLYRRAVLTARQISPFAEPAA
ncbi:MAG: hypothetical protein NWP98_07640 [Erythrobacter sp.]|nr:hypothetical protein [Erythrobacter sp.]